MRNTPTRLERQARTRAELVDAAERLFSEQGFARASLHAVADAAGYIKAPSRGGRDLPRPARPTAGMLQMVIADGA